MDGDGNGCAAATLFVDVVRVRLLLFRSGVCVVVVLVADLPIQVPNQHCQPTLSMYQGEQQINLFVVMQPSSFRLQPSFRRQPSSRLQPSHLLGVSVYSLRIMHLMMPPLKM
jgi:hypothetical protein